MRKTMSAAAMLLALAEAERMAGGPVDVRWALGKAAEQHAVNRDELALLLLEKIINRERAQAAIASMREGDTPAPLPKRKRRRAKT